MTQKIVPLIHVPNMRATIDWYASVGFKVVNEGKEDGREDGEVVWALLSFGNSELMLDIGGKPSTAHRREVDLYIYLDDVDALARRLRDRVEVVVDMNETFYGMREFIIRDINGFWITFGQPVKK